LTEGPQQVRPLVFRLKPFHRTMFYDIYVVAIPLGFVITAISQQSVGRLYAAVVSASLGAALMYVPRVTITADRVIKRDLRNRSAPRSAVAAIHVGRSYVKFVDQRGRTVLYALSGWTKEQLLDMSDGLGVPVYDYRTWYGFCQAGQGRLLIRGQPAR
jgi:hypothetical protein